ncbi:MAG: PqqD family protein [Candidatus Acididesulfobacter guangdongensis]|uniref:PqqD family protein n=1 Tax=Acididesulfobacter guangdongensis TaxID=2597225 RepID=A0A519BEF1_ACIG2|nr:MAG: PqqD family protein [Candidatus Acididesulfobacter guangdongensis]
MNVKYKLLPQYILHNDGTDKYMLFDTQTGGIYKLNAVSFNILSLCSGEYTSDEIKDEILKMFDVDLDVLTEDFNDIITKFLNENIISCPTSP